MTTYSDQLIAIENARELLRDIVSRPQRTMLRSELRQRASSTLRHFPPVIDGVIMFSLDRSQIANCECGQCGRPKDAD
jgi:hypothetical protein